ncbi:MAG: lysostaphin resistance A-like protein [Flavobacteriales bacterium]
MRIPVMYNLPPIFTLAVVMLLSVLGGVLFSLTFAQIGHSFFGFSVFTDSEDFLSTELSSEMINGLKFATLGSHLGMFVLPGIFLVSLFSFSPNRFLNFKPISYFNLLWLPVLLLFFLPLLEYVNLFNEFLLPQNYYDTAWGKLEKSTMDQTLVILRADNLTTLFINLGLVAIIPAIGEELFFRGIVQGLLLRSFKNVHIAIWLTAAVFSLIHFDMSGFLVRFAIGAFLGYVLIITGSILAPMLIHFLNNAYAVIAFYVYSPQSVYEQSMPNNVFVMLAVTLICSGVFYFFFRRNSWSRRKEKYILNSLN